MAALTPSKITTLIEANGYVIRSFTVAVTSNASDTEWIATGLATIDAVVGWAYRGTAAPATAASAAVQAPVFVKNAQGTGVTAGTNHGDLGIEVLSVNMTVEVTVLGRLGR